MAPEEFFVQWTACHTKYSLVRVKAFTIATTDNKVKRQREALEFVRGGYTEVLAQAMRMESQHDFFISRVIRTYLPELYPHVHKAASAAVNGTADEKLAFVTSGFRAALDLDEQNHQAEGVLKAALTAQDRAYISQLARKTKAPVLKRAATQASAPSVGDDAVVEFFISGFAAASATDMAVARDELTAREYTARRSALQLHDEAAAAIKRAEETTGEQRSKALEQARNALSRALEGAEALRRSWNEAQSVAQNEYRIWQEAASKATANQERQPWKSLLASAGKISKQWQQLALDISSMESLWQRTHDELQQQLASIPAQ